jgi:hypothetical protein
MFEKLKGKVIFDAPNSEAEFDLWCDTLGEDKYGFLLDSILKATSDKPISVNDLFNCARYESRIASILYSVFRFAELHYRRIIIQYASEKINTGNTIESLLRCIKKPKE